MEVVKVFTKTLESFMESSLRASVETFPRKRPLLPPTVMGASMEVIETSMEVEVVDASMEVVEASREHAAQLKLPLLPWKVPSNWK